MKHREVQILMSSAEAGRKDKKQFSYHCINGQESAKHRKRNWKLTSGKKIHIISISEARWDGSQHH